MKTFQLDYLIFIENIQKAYVCIKLVLVFYFTRFHWPGILKKYRPNNLWKWNTFQLDYLIFIENIQKAYVCIKIVYISVLKFLLSWNFCNFLAHYTNFCIFTFFFSSIPDGNGSAVGLKQTAAVSKKQQQNVEQSLQRMKIGSYQTLDPRRSRKGKFYWKIDKRHKSCKEECAAALSQCSKLE